MIKNYGFMVISILHIEFYSITNLLKDKLLGLNMECGASRHNSEWFLRVFCPKVQVLKPLEAIFLPRLQMIPIITQKQNQTITQPGW